MAGGNAPQGPWRGPMGRPDHRLELWLAESEGPSPLVPLRRALLLLAGCFPGRAPFEEGGDYSFGR